MGRRGAARTVGYGVGDRHGLAGHGRCIERSGGGDPGSAPGATRLRSECVDESIHIHGSTRALQAYVTCLRGQEHGRVDERVPGSRDR